MEDAPKKVSVPSHQAPRDQAPKPFKLRTGIRAGESEQLGPRNLSH